MTESVGSDVRRHGGFLSIVGEKIQLCGFAFRVYPDRK